MVKKKEFKSEKLKEKDKRKKLAREIRKIEAKAKRINLESIHNT